MLGYRWYARSMLRNSDRSQLQYEFQLPCVPDHAISSPLALLQSSFAYPREKRLYTSLRIDRPENELYYLGTKSEGSPCSPGYVSL